MPIKISLKFEDKYDILFEVEISGSGGRFEIIKEIFVVADKLRIEKTQNEVKTLFNNEEINRIYGNGRIFGLNEEYFRDTIKLYNKQKNKIYEEALKLFETQNKDVMNLFYKAKIAHFYDFLELIKYDNTELSGVISAIDSLEKKCVVLEDMLKTDTMLYINKTLNFIKNIIILKDVNVVEIKPTINPTKNMALAEDGKNMVNVLYNLFLENSRIPEGVKTLLSYIFPNTSVQFKLTEDGRVLMKISENNLESLPQSISSGFFNFLTILTALELKPALIVIDEIENSLYPKAIELLIDKFKNGESQAIITTHSPVVVDMICPNIKDLIL